MPICCILGLFFSCIHMFCLSIPPLPSPLSFYPSPPISSRLSRTPRRWTSNLAIADRTHSASYKQTSANIFILYLCVRQSRLAGRTDGHITFSTCPFICPSVHSYLPLLPTCQRYILTTNEPISIQIAQVVIEARAWMVDLRVTWSKVKVTEAEVRFGGLAVSSLSTRWVE